MSRRLLLALAATSAAACVNSSDAQNTDQDFTEAPDGTFSPEFVNGRTWCYATTNPTHQAGTMRFDNAEQRLWISHYDSNGPVKVGASWAASGDKTQLQLSFDSTSVVQEPDSYEVIEQAGPVSSFRIREVDGPEGRNRDLTLVPIPRIAEGRWRVGGPDALAGNQFCVFSSEGDLGIAAFASDGTFTWSREDGYAARGQWRTEEGNLVARILEFGYGSPAFQLDEAPTRPTYAFEFGGPSDIQHKVVRLVASDQTDLVAVLLSA